MTISSALRSWVAHVAPGWPGTPGSPADLEEVRSAMHGLAASCTPLQQSRMGWRIAQAPSARALWLLRADLFRELALQVGEREATRRMDSLDALFCQSVRDLPGRRIRAC